MKFQVDMEVIGVFDRWRVLRSFNVNSHEVLCSLMSRIADWVQTYMGKQSRFDQVTVRFVPLIFEQREWDDDKREIVQKTSLGRTLVSSAAEAYMLLAVSDGLRETFLHEVVHLVNPRADEKYTRRVVEDLKVAARWERSAVQGGV